MNRYLSFIFIWICVFSNLPGQTDTTKADSLVKYAELDFVSIAEKQAISTFRKGTEIDFFQLALNANPNKLSQPSDWFISIYNKLINDIEAEKFYSLKSDKKIKLIYNKVHEEQLKKYSLYATFDQLFTDGTYNCVTGTMLYGLILTHFNIAFEIKETTQHVFLVAKSENKSIILESTDPNQGYISYNQAFKEQFVKYLQTNKLITSDDVLSQSTDSIFNKFYFQEKNINMLQLCGVQYYNNAISFFSNSNIKQAFPHLKKAYYIYPSERTRYLVYISLLSLIANATYMNETDWSYYVMLSRCQNEIITTTVFSDEFIRLTQKVLTDKSNLDLYNKAYSYIHDNVTDTNLKKEIEFVFNYNLARYYSLKQQNNKVGPYIEAAFKLHPDNYEVQSDFINSILSGLDNAPDEVATFKKIEELYDQYEILRTDTRIKSLVMLF
jgi:hypothetical protein